MKICYSYVVMGNIFASLHYEYNCSWNCQGL